MEEDIPPDEDNNIYQEIQFTSEKATKKFQKNVNFKDIE